MKHTKEFVNTPNKAVVADTTGFMRKDAVNKWVPMLYGFIFTVIIIVTGYVGWNMWKMFPIRQELLFSVKHPELVKPVRELYDLSHKRADEQVKQTILGK